MSKIINGKFKQRRYELTTERQKNREKNRKYAPDLITEKWVDKKVKPKYKRTKPVYFDDDKNIAMIEDKEAMDVTDDEFEMAQISLTEETSESANNNLTLNVECKINNDDQLQSQNVEVDEKLSVENKEVLPNLKPWLDIVDYPNCDYKIDLNICNITIDKNSIATLKPNCAIEDNIIDAFINAIIIEANNKYVLCFDSHFSQWILNPTTIRCGFVKWAASVKAWTFNIWLIPIFQNSHWTLIIIDFINKYYVYIDSMHGNPPSNLIKNCSSFIEKLFKRKDIPFHWNTWTLCIPKDILHQGSTLNCGVHLMLWAYILLKEKELEFLNSDMDFIRKWIYFKLVNANGLQRNEIKNKRFYDLPPANVAIKSEIDKMQITDYIPLPNIPKCQLKTMYYFRDLVKSITERYTL
ncbi:sentrin-specific protease 5-like [Prorops nasuta]|uniref:sentrin-specific protease 5-like n=1 Tax=Prorops nasuta TaxID=863751 RepID=UPI0034D00D7E